MRKPSAYVVVASLAVIMSGCGSKDVATGGSCNYTAQLDLPTDPPSKWQAPTCLDFTTPVMPEPELGPVGCQTLLAKGASPWTQASCSSDNLLGVCSIETGPFQFAAIFFYRTATPPVDVQARIAASACPILGLGMFQGKASWVTF